MTFGPTTREPGRSDLGMAIAARRIRRLEDLPNPDGKAVLVRATLDLPIGLDEHVPMAAYRGHLLGETLRWLTTAGARVTVTGDLGTDDEGEVARRRAELGELLEALAPGAVLAANLEQTGPAGEDAASVATLVASHDLFVNDSFQSSHLPLPSLLLPAEQLPSAAGRSLEHDLVIVSSLLAPVERPFVAVLGGDRPFSSLRGLEGLVLRADTVLVGGALTGPFLEALGKQAPSGTSQDFLAECRRVYGLGKTVLHQVTLPLDLVWGRGGARPVVTPADVAGEGEVIDIGPLTRTRFGELVAGAGLVLWLGALGHIEDADSREGTRAVANAIRAADRSAVLGGDALVTFLHEEGLVDKRAEILTATDAALELLKGGELPALGPLRAD